MKRMIGALTFAIAIAATTLMAQQPRQQENAQLTKAGWWVRVDTKKTDAKSITLQVGTKAGNRRAWRAWHEGDGYEFDVPRDLQSAKELYIQASSNPDGKTTRFCVYFQSMGMKRFDFSGDKEEQIKKSDRDEACK